jgi:uncharacterized protein YecE (DUF72 family)
MEFGRLPENELPQVDFGLPPDHPQTTMVLGGKKKKPIVYVGAAKWGRPDWVNLLYPKGTKAADFLSHYVQHFNSIELNATFHQPHSRETIEKWAAVAGKGFKFCPKVYQSISHWKRLKDAHTERDNFIERMRGFGDKLGPMFLQVHDNFGPKSLDILQQFLEDWPTDVAMQLELRNTGWFDANAMIEDLYHTMQKRGIGFVITDAAGRRDVVHVRLTNTTAFIRWVGNNLHPTDYPRIDEWAIRLKEWMKTGIKDIYFLVHNHDEANTPVLCNYTVRKFNEVLGTDIKPPTLIGGDDNKLF